MEDISVLVAITHTGETMAGLESKLSKWIYEFPHKAELHLSQINPTYSNRNTVVKYFLEKTNHTHLLFIDSDTVPFDNPLPMSELDLDIVGGVYPAWRVDHYEWLAMLRQPDGHYKMLPQDKRKGIVECDGLGAGCMMIKREVLQAIEAPFADKIRKDGRREIGHDYYFCERAKALGYKVYANWEVLCDHVKLIPLITIVQALKKCYDEGYKNGFDKGKAN
jgi:hypothetical protein